MGPTNAPTKKAWNRVFYGPDMSSQGTSETKTETVSTISNTSGFNQQTYDEGIKKLQAENTAANKKHGDHMLYEVREMTAKSDERTKTLEAMSESHLSESVNSLNPETAQTQQTEPCEINDLCQYLHSDAMEIDTVLRKRQLPPSAEDSLRDGGRKNGA